MPRPFPPPTRHGRRGSAPEGAVTGVRTATRARPRAARGIPPAARRPSRSLGTHTRRVRRTPHAARVCRGRPMCEPHPARRHRSEPSTCGVRRAACGVRSSVPPSVPPSLHCRAGELDGQEGFNRICPKGRCEPQGHQNPINELSQERRTQMPLCLAGCLPWLRRTHDRRR